MTIVAPATVAMLLAAASLFLAWAPGLPWPDASEALPVPAVAGVEGATRMPGLVSSLVLATALRVMAAVALRRWNLPGLPPRPAGLAAASVFLARRGGAWRPFRRTTTPQRPLTRPDVLIHGPPWLAHGAGPAFIALRSRA